MGALRPDGYHALHTVYQAIGLYDEVTLSAADPGTGLVVSVVGEYVDGVPTTPANLAARAVAAVAEHAGRPADAHIEIRKAIPVQAGLAGGSADAAAALVAADALWHTGLDRAAMTALAATLGSDVGFLLPGGVALGVGRGEQVSPVLARGEHHWVLAVADGGLSTPAVYAELDRLRAESQAPTPVGTTDGVVGALAAGDTVALGRSLANDLQPAALSLRPGLRRVLDAGRELGAVGGVVSGSGPTVALLARTRGDAVSMASSLAGYGVCRTVRHALGPVAGARVVTSPGPATRARG